MKHSRTSAQKNYRHSLAAAFSSILIAPLLRPIPAIGMSRVAGGSCCWSGRGC